MLLRTTKLEQAIKEFDDTQSTTMQFKCVNAQASTEMCTMATDSIQEDNTRINSVENCIKQSEVCINQNEDCIAQDEDSIQHGSDITNEDGPNTVNGISKPVADNKSPEEALFTEMYRHAVVRESNPCIKTQYAVDDMYLLYNGASLYFCSKRLLEDEPVGTELPANLRKWCDLLPQLTFTSTGNVHKIYSEVKKAYTKAVKEFAKHEKNCRGSDLHTLYTISPLFSWQPVFVKQLYAYNVARVWYTMQYAGISGVNFMGVCICDDIPLLKIESSKGTVYLMPRCTDVQPKTL